MNKVWKGALLDLQSYCPLTCHQYFLLHISWTIMLMILWKFSRPIFFLFLPTYYRGGMPPLKNFKHHLMNKLSPKIFKLRSCYSALILRMKTKSPYSLFFLFYFFFKEWILAFSNFLTLWSAKYLWSYLRQDLDIWHTYWRWKLDHLINFWLQLKQKKKNQFRGKYIVGITVFHKHRFLVIAMSVRLVVL